MKKALIVLIAQVLIACPNLYAQDRIIQGTVKHINTRLEISGVNIYIKGTADWAMVYGNTIQFLSPGEYEIIPYIRIIQNEIPAELIKSIGENADKLHRDFLKLPTKQQYGNIVIPG